MRILATSVGVPFAIVVVGASAIIGSHLGAVLRRSFARRLTNPTSACCSGCPSSGAG
jgi:hypothetical protein